jgi:hypothetical protein
MAPDPPTGPPEPVKVEFQRLPKNMVPVHYNIFIELNFRTGETFNGITTLNAQVKSQSI